MPNWEGKQLATYICFVCNGWEIPPHLLCTTHNDIFTYIVYPTIVEGEENETEDNKQKTTTADKQTNCIEDEKESQTLI